MAAAGAVAAAAAPAGGGPGLFVVDADRTPPQANAGRLDVQLRMYLEPKEEFKQIFKEGWRNQRDYLYVPNLHGANWTKMEEMYGQILPHVMHRADLNYLLDNMGAEIAVGHSYVRGGAMPDVPAAGGGGLLGADFAIENGRYKITRIYDNESWNPELRAPLHMPGVDVSVGEYLIAINGEELRAPDNIYRLLDGTANRQTVLTVNGKPVLDGARHVTVIPLRVGAGTSDARVGRAQPPARWTSSRAASWPTSICPTRDRAGIRASIATISPSRTRWASIVDERFNGGGSAADYIIDVLQRDFDGYFNNVAGDRYAVHEPVGRASGDRR